LSKVHSRRYEGHPVTGQSCEFPTAELTTALTARNSSWRSFTPPTNPVFLDIRAGSRPFLLQIRRTPAKRPWSVKFSNSDIIGAEIVEDLQAAFTQFAAAMDAKRRPGFQITADLKR